MMRVLICFVLLHEMIQYRIAFGSCYKSYANKTQAFKAINNFLPDIFIWLGDAAYVTSTEGITTLNQTRIEQKFNQTKNHPDYQELLKSTVVQGIWVQNLYIIQCFKNYNLKDDHDYNQMDGNRNNPTKEMIRTLYLNFLDEPSQSIRRTQNGIYHSFFLGLEIQIILLDVRWNRDPKDQFPTREILGQEQWNWLEDKLKSDAKYQIIGSGSQILPDDRMFIELWSTECKQRLLKLIQLYGKNVILISGDVHFGEILNEPCFKMEQNKNLFEVTSSGLSNSRIISGYLGYIFETFVYIFIPDTYSLMSDRYIGINFGGIVIEDDQISIQIFDEHGNIKFQRQINKEQEDAEDVMQQCSKTQTYPKFLRYFYNFNMKISKIFQLKIFPFILIFIGIITVVFQRKIKQLKKRKTL